jgi:hypothetical protein
MTEQTQVDIQKISDLELGELLAGQMAQLFQFQQNVNALQAELNRRKQDAGKRAALDKLIEEEK